METKKEIDEIIENIKKVEGYFSLTPVKRKRKMFVADNGDYVIVNVTRKHCPKTKNQGNFAEILGDREVWKRLLKHPYGCYYIIAVVNGKFMYYRTDLKTIIINRDKDTPSRDEDRYLLRIQYSDAENGNKFMRVNGNHAGVTLFEVTMVDVTSTEIEQPCYVYLMTNERNGYTKIGLANVPKYRERTLQSEEPTIILKKQLKLDNRSDAFAMESELHIRYKDYRVRGEWYNLSDKMLVELLNDYDWRKPQLS